LFVSIVLFGRFIGVILSLRILVVSVIGLGLLCVGVDCIILGLALLGRWFCCNVSPGLLPQGCTKLTGWLLIIFLPGVALFALFVVFLLALFVFYFRILIPS
jgi:hypothetical protein